MCIEAFVNKAAEYRKTANQFERLAQAFERERDKMIIELLEKHYENKVTSLEVDGIGVIFTSPATGRKLIDFGGLEWARIITGNKPRKPNADMRIKVPVFRSHYCSPFDDDGAKELEVTISDPDALAEQYKYHKDNKHETIIDISSSVMLHFLVNHKEITPSFYRIGDMKAQLHVGGAFDGYIFIKQHSEHDSEDWVQARHRFI